MPLYEHSLRVRVIGMFFFLFSLLLFFKVLRWRFATTTKKKKRRLEEIVQRDSGILKCLRAKRVEFEL